MEIKNLKLLNTCVKIEEEGQVFYKELAIHVSEPVIKDYLLMISEQEAKHEKLFKKFLEEKGNQKYGWEDKPDLHILVEQNFEQGFFPKLNEIFEKFPGGEGIKIALEFAKKYEEQSIEFYATLIKNCDDWNAKALLIDLESEEKAHLCYIQQLIWSFPYEHQNSLKVVQNKRTP
jgi:rubrerythrin